MTLTLGQRWLTEQHRYPTLRGAVFQGFWHVPWCKFLNLPVPEPFAGRCIRVAAVERSILVDRHRRHRDGLVREVAAVARSAHDRIDDVESTGDLAEQRVVLRQLAG